jgi:hypothetical protein
VSPRCSQGIPLSADNGVDLGVVPGRLRGSWGILVRRDAAASAARPPELSQEGLP